MTGRRVYSAAVREHSGGEAEYRVRYTVRGFNEQESNDFTGRSAPTMAFTAYLINEARAAADEAVLREGWDVSGAYYMAILSTS